MNYFYDLFLEKTETLNHALEKANERCRLMLYVSTLGSFLLLVVVFNTYYSWNRKVNAKDRILLAEEIGAISPWQMRSYNYELGKELGVSDLETFHQNISRNIIELDHRASKKQLTPEDAKVADALTHYFDNLNKNGLLIDKISYFDMFFKRQAFTIPLLGLSCSETDLFFIGGIFTVILLIYSYFNARREERILYRIVKSVKFIDHANIDVSLGIKGITDEPEVTSIKYRALEILFQGCINSFVFTTVANDSDDYWIYDSHEAAINRLPNSDDYWQSLNSIPKGNNIARWIKRYIDYLPVASLIIIGVCDLNSYFQVMTYLSGNDIFEFWFKFALGFTLLIVALRQCRILNTVNTNMAYHLLYMHRTVKSYRNKLKNFRTNN